jgi:hypothetical protein
MQGIVLALAPFHNSCNYASAVVHGYASVVTNEAERLFAITRITDNLVVCTCLFTAVQFHVAITQLKCSINHKLGAPLG